MSINVLCLLMFYSVSGLDRNNRGNIKLMFFNENVFRLFRSPVSLAAIKGTCNGSCCSDWRIPGSFMSVLVILSLH